MKHVLFVCSRNRWRSPTAEHVFAAYPGVACRSAGLAADAENPLDAELVCWAELIFVMEKIHRTRLGNRFGRELGERRVICLGIADNYRYMQPELVTLLRHKVTPFLPQA